MKDRRFHYVDAARGIAVLLVIYGHTFRESMRAAYAWCDFSYALVYRFHVSLLFLLSGFGYALTLEKNKTLTEWRYLGKKSKSSFVAVVFLFRPDLCDICHCAAFCTVQGAFGKYCLSENSPGKIPGCDAEK